MANNAYKELFDMNFKILQDLQTASAKYEAKTGVSINCLNFSVAIWAITTTILFNIPLLHFILVLIYLFLSAIFITIVIFGWRKGFSATDFKDFYSFKLDPDFNKEFLEGNDEYQNKIYGRICDILLEGTLDFEKILESRKQSVKCAKRLSISALAISILLVFMVLFGKIYESYGCKIKSQICVMEYNNNFNNIGVFYENNGTERESAK
ncbi:MAG: hypothetical protein LBB36_04020 [Fibromonadaceae bacterium]|nr:hypothetical protein [Fibromonadaceae bacterium]